MMEIELEVELKTSQGCLTNDPLHDVDLLHCLICVVIYHVGSGSDSRG